MSEALELGLSRKSFYGMRDHGDLEQLSRGLFRLRDETPLGHPDFVIVARRIPTGVICLISALAYHELTTQVPHRIDVAVERGTRRPPRIDYPPVDVHQFARAAFREGIEVHELDALPVRIYSPEKSIADIFKYRNRVGLEVAVEALRLWHRGRRRDVEKLLRHARTCRVESVLRPYLEALK